MSINQFEMCGVSEDTALASASLFFSYSDIIALTSLLFSYSDITLG